MRSWWLVSLGLIVAVPATTWGQSATLSVRPSVVVGAPGSTIDVPVCISSTELVSVVRFTVEYDSTIASYQSARLGADAQAANFSIAATNSNLPFDPESPGTNDNVLILAMSASNTWITGTNRQLVILTFQLAGGGCAQSPMNFDLDCNHTDGSTFNGGLLCGPSLVLQSGVVANGCVADVPAAGGKPFVLHQNVPNPFNPTTRIAFDVGAPGRVTLEVFAVDGNRVHVLLDAVMPAGRHEAIWDGRDADGRRVPSGIYYYQMRAGDTVASHPMVLLK